MGRDSVGVVSSPARASKPQARPRFLATCLASLWWAAYSRYISPVDHVWPRGFVRSEPSWRLPRRDWL